MEERKPGRPRAQDKLEWRTVVRLPRAVGAEIEELAAETRTPVAVLARAWVSDGLKRAKAARNGR